MTRKCTLCLLAQLAAGVLAAAAADAVAPAAGGRLLLQGAMPGWSYESSLHSCALEALSLLCCHSQTCLGSDAGPGVTSVSSPASAPGGAGCTAAATADSSASTAAANASASAAQTVAGDVCGSGSVQAAADAMSKATAQVRALQPCPCRRCPVGRPSACLPAWLANLSCPCLDVLVLISLNLRLLLQAVATVVANTFTSVQSTPGCSGCASAGASGEPACIVWCPYIEPTV